MNTPLPPSPATDATGSPDRPPTPAAAAADPLSMLLPVVNTPLSPAAIVKRLDELARRGKLAGFHAGGSGGTGGTGGAGATERVSFHVTDFGTPFETVLDARVRARAGPGSDGGTTLEFSTRLKPLMPLVFLAVLVTTVWPGVWLTDSILRVYFPSYGSFLSGRGWATWMWYLPLTVPFVPLSMWTAIKRSRASGYTQGKEMVQKIRAALEGA